jgi:hypothetical protein
VILIFVNIFLVAIKCRWPIPTLISIYIVVFIHYCTCYNPEYGWNTADWTLSNAQSINLNYVLTHNSFIDFNIFENKNHAKIWLKYSPNMVLNDK